MLKKLFWRIWPFTLLGRLLDELDELRTKNRQLSELSVDSLSISERSGMVISMSSGILPVMADAMMKLFVDNGGKNYVKWTLAASTDSDFKEPYTLTMQRVFGETSAQQIARRDEAIQAAVDRLRRLPVDFEGSRELISSLESAMVNRPWIPPDRYTKQYQSGHVESVERRS